MTVFTTTNTEIYLAACLLSRPEFVNVLYPVQRDGSESTELAKIDNNVARSTISVLSTKGAVYANPNALQAALADLPLSLEEDDIVSLFSQNPEPSTVQLADLVTLKDQIETVYQTKALGRTLKFAYQNFQNKQPSEVIEVLENAIKEHRRGSIGVDHSSAGILSRIGEGSLTTRWKIAYGVEGGELLDDQSGLQGKTPTGEFGSGASGQGETIVVVGQYGAGKTRWAVFNTAVSLLKQGALLDIVAGEDSEASYALKLIAVKFDIPAWKISRYLIEGVTFAHKEGQEEIRKIQEAIEWFKGLGNQLRIYDGQNTKVNIFKFRSAKGLLEESIALNGTTHLFIDYFQMWKGDTTTLETYAQELRELAARNNVGIFLLSQIPGEAQKYGTSLGILPTKGSTELGQIAHLGYFLQQDPTVGQKELLIQQMKGRDAGLNQVVARMNPETGKVLEYYGTPIFMTPKEEKQQYKGKRR